MKPSQVTIICDLQFGSTGKGLIAGYLAKRNSPDVLVTSWMPNAGHTYIDSSGKKYVHTMLANGIVSKNLEYVLLGPGSVIDLPSLFREIKLAGLPDHVKILIHPAAPIVHDRHRQEESTGSMVAIGSTRKGSGAALMEKIRRDKNVNTIAQQTAELIAESAKENGCSNVTVTSHEKYERILDEAYKIQVEGAQGFSLGMNSGFWPYTTSRECTPAQIASDCLIPLSWITDVIGTVRTYPIRVANRFDDQGNMVGWSGPCYPDQDEITWDEINQRPEFTTVTKLPRRIFTFSQMQISEALRRVEPTALFLNFVNYISPDDLRQLRKKIDDTAACHGCGGVRYLGYGPTDSDVVDLAMDQRIRNAKYEDL